MWARGQRKDAAWLDAGEWSFLLTEPPPPPPSLLLSRQLGFRSSFNSSLPVSKESGPTLQQGFIWTKEQICVVSVIPGRTVSFVVAVIFNEGIFKYRSNCRFKLSCRTQQFEEEIQVVVCFWACQKELSNGETSVALPDLMGKQAVLPYYKILIFFKVLFH